MVLLGELITHQSPGDEGPVPSPPLFKDLVTNHRVTAMCDNSMVVAYVNKQGAQSPTPFAC